jgi:hypothetical protein
MPSKSVIERMIEGTGRRRRKRMELLGDFKEKTGHWKLKEAMDPP